MFALIPLSAAGHAYLALVLGILAASLGVPVPEEVPLLTAGLLAAVGVIDLWWAIVAGAGACFTGDLFVFIVGRRIGSHLSEHPYLNRIMRGKYVQRAQQLYIDRGPWTLFVARLLPGLKMPFLFTAGALRMPWGRFLFFDICSVCVLVPALVLLGYHSSAPLARLQKLVRDIGLAGVVITVLVVGTVVALYLLRRRRRQMLAALLIARQAARDAEQAGGEPAGDAPAGAEAAPAGDEGTAGNPARDKSAGEEPAEAASAGDEGTADNPARDNSAGENPAEAAPAGDEGTADNPARDNSAGEDPAEEGPAAHHERKKRRETA